MGDGSHPRTGVASDGDRCDGAGVGPRVKGIAVGIPVGWIGGGILARIADNLLWPGFGGQLDLAFNNGDRVLYVLVNLGLVIGGIVFTCRWMVGWFRRRAVAKQAPPPVPPAPLA